MKIRIGSELRREKIETISTLHGINFKSQGGKIMARRKRRKKSSGKKTGTKWIKIKGKGMRCYSYAKRRFVKKSACKGKKK